MWFKPTAEPPRQEHKTKNTCNCQLADWWRLSKIKKTGLKLNNLPGHLLLLMVLQGRHQLPKKTRPERIEMSAPHNVFLVFVCRAHVGRVFLTVRVLSCPDRQIGAAGGDNITFVDRYVYFCWEDVTSHPRSFLRKVEHIFVKSASTLTNRPGCQFKFANATVNGVWWLLCFLNS